MDRIRVEQINLQGSAVCLEDFAQVIKDRKLDVALVQEPYSRQGRVPQVGGSRQYYLPGKPGGVGDGDE
jgi:hypothetical protein